MKDHWEKITAFVFILLCFNVAVLSQGLPSLGVSPMRSFVQLAPGEGYSGSFRVTNTGEETLPLRIVLKDFVFDEEGAFMGLDPGTMATYSLTGCLAYSPERMTLEPGESQEVDYSFTLPADAVPSPHWAALIITSEETQEEVTQPEGEEGITLTSRFEFNYAFIILQRPIVPLEPTGQIIGMEVAGSTKNGEKSLAVRSTFQNLGEGVLTCQAYMEARNETGDVILHYDFPPDRMVLPNAKRVFSHTFANVDMPPGQHLILCVVDFGGEYLAARQYQATVKDSE